MSLLKTIRQQLGLSPTPANNFTLDASADNGTMKIARGNAGATTQDVMTVDASGKVAFPQGRVYAPGEIIQQTITTDAGSGTSSTTATNVTVSAILFTPKSTNSTLLVTCSGYAYSGTNTYSYNFSNLRIHESGSPIGPGTISIGSGQVATQWIGPAVAQAKLANSALTQRSFTMYMWNYAYGSNPCAMTGQVWTITEIQN